MYVHTYKEKEKRILVLMSTNIQRESFKTCNGCSSKKRLSNRKTWLQRAWHLEAAGPILSAASEYEMRIKNSSVTGPSLRYIRACRSHPANRQVPRRGSTLNFQRSRLPERTAPSNIESHIQAETDSVKSAVTEPHFTHTSTGFSSNRSGQA